MVQDSSCDPSAAKTTEQAESATPTAPAGVADQIRNPGAIFPQIALLAGNYVAHHHPSLSNLKTSLIVTVIRHLSFAAMIAPQAIF